MKYKVMTHFKFFAIIFAFYLQELRLTPELDFGIFIAIQALLVFGPTLWSLHSE